MLLSKDAQAPGPPGSQKPPYDLASRDADYPVWEGSPRRTILICTHPRSGSTLLGEAVYFAGGLGCPLEYFHRGFRPFLAERWQAPSIQSYIRAVHRFRTDTTGVLSVKLFWIDVEDMVREMSPSLFEELRDVPSAAMAPETYLKIRELLAGIFPNPSFVYLTRRDRVRQAVSGLVATQSRLWRSLLQDGELSPLHEVAYDYDQILSLLALSGHCNAQWRNFLRAAADSFYAIAYEDLANAYASTVRNLFKSLGYRRQAPTPRLRRQSEVRSERMVLRFLKECAQRMPVAAEAHACGTFFGDQE
jgi:trehalose 2-sulfotransferase